MLDRIELGWVLAGGALLLSLGVTAAVRRYALARELIDHPNPRGSHQVATPRGGGAGIVLAIIAGAALLGWLGLLSPGLTLSLTLGGGAVALVGWVDDHGHVDARWRALVHLAAAAWALYQLGGLDTLQVGRWEIPLGPFGIPLALIAIVWLTNLYNFMDGIDGLAAIQGIFAAATGAALLVGYGQQGGALLCLVIAAACAGFLYWNRPPARIFMGDIGSGFLGYCFAVVALAGEQQGSLPVQVWLLLMALFIADASYTLSARIWRGEPWYRPHRQHAYQRQARALGSHRRVDLLWGSTNLLLILPAAWWVSRHPAYGPPLLVLVYLALWLAWRLTPDARPQPAQ